VHVKEGNARENSGAAPAGDCRRPEPGKRTRVAPLPALLFGGVPTPRPNPAYCITPVRRTGVTPPRCTRSNSRRSQSSAAFTARTFTVERGPG
jgi:hypothetical protein